VLQYTSAPVQTVGEPEEREASEEYYRYFLCMNIEKTGAKRATPRSARGTRPGQDGVRLRGASRLYRVA
jgi:hypothetical protein